MLLGGKEFKSRLLIGTSRYPSPEVMKLAIARSGAEIATVSLRRQDPKQGAGNPFWNILKSCHITLLPNTAGCRTAKEAITTAHLARELFDTNWIKLEVIGDEYTLQPDPFGLTEAAKVLVDEGFEVFPYMTEDLSVAEKLLSVGCKILMPWGSPIGSGQGLANPTMLKTLRNRFSNVPLILDAGIGKPSQATAAMELGFDAVLLNTAIALAQDPPTMAEAFGLAVKAGRQGYEAGLMSPRETAAASTPLIGRPFWHAERD